MPPRGVIVPVVVVVIVTLVFQTCAVDIQQCKDDTSDCASNSTQNSTVNSTSPALPIVVNGTNTTSPDISFATPDDVSVNRTTSGRALNMTQLLQDLTLDDVEETAVTSQARDNATTTSTTTTTTTKEILSVTQAPTNTSAALSTVCLEGGAMRSEGERWHRGCEEACVCRAGQAICTPRCAMPMFRRGLNTDPHCVERPSGEDECCTLLVCDSAAVDVASDSKKPCEYKNQTYREGETISDGCEAVCTCAEQGKVTCKSRCPANNATTSDRCLTLPDPTDPCCKVVLCDVTLGDHDVSKGSEEVQLPLLTAEVVDGTGVRLELAGATPENFTVEASEDQETWRPQEAHGLLVMGLRPGKSVYLRVTSGTAVSNSVEILLSKPTEGSAKSCSYKKQNYTVGKEFHDGCDAYCMCTSSGVQCANIECPTDFGLDVLDPQCVTWENVPKDFVPSPPTCCPEKVQCKDNGSCVYLDQRFDNWAEIPVSVTGCEKRCYCEFGKVSCQAACPPVTASPPADLDCPPGHAMLNHLPGDNCCKYWLCPPIDHQTGFSPQTPPRFPSHSSSQPDEVTVQTLEPLDEHTIRLVFSVPPVLVGLHGRIELRYSDDVKNMDEASWQQQVLAPPDDLIATQQLEFELGGLQPDTLYKIKIGVLLRDLHNSPSSPILTVRTLPLSTPSTTLPPQIPVDAALELGQANATWALLRWRKFTENEMQFIDGVQLRYKELDGKVYAATPLIHRAVTTYTLEGLKPDTRYEVAIFFIPFPGQMTELQDERSVQIHTAQVQDLYAFSVEVTVHHEKSTSVEISWSGVPYPEDKYVNIFRAIYQSESGKEDLNTFKVAKRETQPKAIIMDLKPGTRYRLWLEVYLTNGRIKKSNVKDFMTKPGSDTTSTQQGKLERAEPTLEAGNYYGPLVAVAILAALAIVAALILLLILVRKYGQNKATISAHPRPAHQAAYDNPSYKVEIQQETMGTAHS